MNKLATAIKIASAAFESKEDKGGQPYILHCLHVMHNIDPKDEDLRIIAVLHDLVEDTDWGLVDLKHAGFSMRVISAVNALTHKSDESYDAYIKRISLNEDARKVKLADLRHNSDIHRMKGLRKKDFDRLEKYHKAYAYLNY